MIHANWKGNVQIFKTNCSTRAFDDWLSEDMYSGGHSMESLISLYGTIDVGICSPRVWDKNVCSTRLSYKELAKFAKSPQKYAREIEDYRRALFKLFRDHAQVLSFVGSSRNLIDKLITCFENQTQRGYFRDISLNKAFESLINRAPGRQNATVLLKELIATNIDWRTGEFQWNEIPSIKQEFANRAYLPKFTGALSWVDGTKISVHDIHALKIHLRELKIKGTAFIAKFEFVGQDHFGLDFDDVRKYNYPIFRAWCTLQHSKLFRHEPFFTDMYAFVTIAGSIADAKRRRK